MDFNEGLFTILLCNVIKMRKFLNQNPLLGVPLMFTVDSKKSETLKKITALIEHAFDICRHD